MPRKKRAGAGAKRKSRRGPGRPRSTGGAQSAISGLSAYRNHLLAQRDDVDQRIAAIDNALVAMGSAARPGRPAGIGPGPGPGRGRHGPRKGSLKEYIGKVLAAKGGVMAVKDITAGVLKIGYRTKNKTLAKSVGIALTEMPRVRKVGRGQFSFK